MNCMVIDIDGTIAEPLRGVINASGQRASWEAAIIATPPKPVVNMRTLLQAAAQGGLYAVYATARRRSTLREATVLWLADTAFPHPSAIYMRDDDLRLAPDVLKIRYLHEMTAAGWNPVVWFEDDKAVIAALRHAGVNAIAC